MAKSKDKNFDEELISKALNQIIYVIRHFAK